MSERKPVLTWSEAERAGARSAGGKGWNLGRLARYGFAVPRGGVLSAEVYALFMSAPHLRDLQEALGAVTHDRVFEPDVAETLLRLQNAIHDTPLPDRVVKGIQRYVQQHDLAAVPMAVRSSATAEDGKEASFAGIHESFLNVQGVGAVVDAVKGCYASLWKAQALAYRRRLSMKDSDVACAVVVCEMVGAERNPCAPPVSAGVAFSCEPRSGRVDLVTISAVRGLGNGLVGGSENPETISVGVDRFQPAVVERLSPSEEVLSDALALKLTRLVQRVHWALGDGQDPQDVEWAFDGSTFWIVQARPVTRLPRRTSDGAKSLPVVWTNGNLKDALPGVLTPMAWSVVQPTLRQVLYVAHRAVGYSVPEGLETTRRFHGRAYLDLSTLAWLYYDAMGLKPDEFIRSLGGQQPPMISVPEGDPLGGIEGKARKRRQFRLLRILIKLQKRLPEDIKQVYAYVRGIKEKEYSRLSLSEIRSTMIDLAEQASRFNPKFALANNSAGVGTAILTQILTKVAPERAETLAGELMAGSGAVTSAEQGYRILDLVASLKEDEAAKAYMGADPMDPNGWRTLSEQSPFRRELEAFLAEFGHRSVYEGEIANPRWNEDPSYILRQVRALMYDEALVERLRGARAAARERRRVAEKEIGKRTRLLRPLVNWMAERARRAYAQREAAKSALVALLEPNRHLTLDVGRRMVGEALLDQADDIFYLTWSDVELYLLEEWDGDGAKALVAVRKEQRERWLKERAADVIVIDDAGCARGWPDDFDQVSPQTSVMSDVERPSSQDVPATRRIRPEQGRALRGVSVSPGKAVGPARILNHPEQGDTLRVGDVLVAPSTDPGWTPLFTRASALVMEVGGYHSHGAIVAREYGIPAVANIPKVVHTLRDGERLTVDGDLGAVYRDE